MGFELWINTGSVFFFPFFFLAAFMLAFPKGLTQGFIFHPYCFVAVIFVLASLKVSPHVLAKKWRRGG